MKKPSFDYIIVGAGILGVCTAYLLQKRFSDCSILLLDQAAAGSSTSLYSGGYFTADANDAITQSILLESFNLYHKVIFPDLNQNLFNPIQTIWCFDDSAQSEQLQSCFSLTQKPKPQKHNNPVFNTHDNILYSDHTTFYCSVYLLIRAMIKNLLEKPTFKCWESVSVLATTSNDDAVSVRLKDQRILYANKIIFCTGPWLLEQNLLSNELPILRRKKVTSVYLDYPTHKNDVAYLYYGPDVFFLPLYPEPRWLMSFTSQEWDCSLNRSDLVLAQEDINQARQLIEQYCPQLQTNLGGGSVFADIYTQNKNPIVDYRNNDKRQIVITGMSGSGFRYAPGFVNYVIDHFM